MSAEGASRLEEVGLAHEAAYLDMVADFERAGEGYGWNDAETARADFAAFVRDLAREARGEALPPGVPAQTTYILLDADWRALGEIRFRPEPGDDLDALLEANGHLGYNVRPSARSQGHATRMLTLALEWARAAGLTRVMLPVKDDNLASARVVERNGGRLERRVVGPESGDLMRVYWIALA